MARHKLKFTTDQTKGFTRTNSHRSLGGFTIIELLIATTVFSVILLMATFGLLQVGRTYYRGVTLMKTQTAARSIIDTISQDIQFSGSSVNAPVTYPSDPPDPDASDPYAICIGNNRYSVRIDKQIPNETDQALNVDKVVACNTGDPLNLVPGSGQSCNLPDCRELIDQNMRVAQLKVEDKGNNFYYINLTIIYGDTDLLEQPNHQKCKLEQAGSQFCATVNLSTTVQKRIAL